jgi:hypothetical protein
VGDARSGGRFSPRGVAPGQTVSAATETRAGAVGVAVVVDSRLGSRAAVGCWSEAWSVPLVDMGVLSETRHARTAGGVRIAHQVVGADPLDILRVGDGLSQVEMTWELPVGAQFHTRPALFSRLIRFDKRGAGLSDPVPLHEIPDLELGEVGPGAEPYPPDRCWAKPDLDAAADAMRHLYGHPEVARELGVGRERASPAHTTRRRPRSANGLPPRPGWEPTDER